MSETDHHARLAELEQRIAEQDKVIADLNEMVVAQWRKIDNLERRFGELRDEFDAAALARPDGEEPPPPHYSGDDPLTLRRAAAACGRCRRTRCRHGASSP